MTTKIKYLITAIVFIIYGNFLFGQLHIGGKGGLNFATIKYSNPTNERRIKPYKKIRPGIVAGAIIHYNMNPAISLQSDLIFSQQGFRTKYPTFESKNTMEYLNLNVSAHLFLLEKDDISVSIFVGPYSGYWISGKYISHDLKTNETKNEKVKFDAEYEYNRIDAGVNVGTAIQLYANDAIWQFDLCYKHGLLDDTVKDVDGVLQRFFSLQVSYLFEMD